MSESTSDSGSELKLLALFGWIISLIIVALISYNFGKNSNKLTQKVVIPSISVESTPTTPLPTATTSTAPSPVDLESLCTTTGPSQKKDYLVTYYMREGDNISSIAEKELGDVTRTTEIIALNEGGPALTVGSALYLPPANIKQSSGHISEVAGKIVKRDTVSWQLSYGGGATGPGIVIPGFWFKDIPYATTYKIGDCVTILFDNGVKVYSVKKS